MARLFRVLRPIGAAAGFGVILAGFAGRGEAMAFPPISAAEQALTAVAEQPNAPAVVLFRKGELHMGNPAPGARELGSYLEVQARVKILTEAGRSQGDVKLAHNGYFRIQDFEGRTVLADGTVVPLAKDVQFVSTSSRVHKVLITKVAFPAVAVGAILDYHYTIRWDSFVFLDPWIFQDRIPVLHSEIVYDIPPTLGVTGWKSDPMTVGVHSETSAVLGGKRLRAWADNLPAVPEEAFSLPFTEMAAEEVVLPTEYGRAGQARQPLFQDWASTCKLFDELYAAAKRDDGQAERVARGLADAVPAAAAGGASRERRQAEAVYAFVRDEVATQRTNRIGLPAKDSGVGAVLERKRGEPAEKALLLQVMLAALKIKSRLVWAANREDGAVDLQIPNPVWFDRLLVAAQIDGQRVYLDPADRALCFGHLEPGYEGTQAVLFEGDKPELITLPEAPFDQNLRRSRIELTVDASGRATGSGTLELRGNPAWQRTRWKGAFDSPAAAWEEVLRKEFPTYDVAGVTISESLDEPRVTVAWTLAQHPEEALGDQETLIPSRPLGPARQPFPPGVKRLSPVAFPFASREEVELTVHWAAGWSPEVLPAARQVETFAGAMVTRVDVDAANRTLTYHRRFDRAHWKTVTADQYRLIQHLYGEAEKSDAQALVLAHR
jgi:hypothetical protein